MNNTKRNVLGDVLRGFAIFLVVFGHCIQEGSGLDFSTGFLYFQDKLYQFIYSFHMPLFMLIAGYYMYNSIVKATDTKSRWKMFFNKISIYFFPMVIWAIIEDLIILYTMTKVDFDFASNIDLVLVNLGTVFYTRLLTGLWFLWAMIICFTIVFLVHFYLKDSIIVYGIIYLSLFIIPDDYNLSVYKYVMPFYIVAFYFHMYKENLCQKSIVRKCVDFYNRKSWICVLISAAVFGALFIFYNMNTFIYVSHYRISRATLISQTITDVYRMVIGFAGSIFFILLFMSIIKLIPDYKFPVLSVLSRNSLGIYVLSSYFIIMVVRQYFTFASHNYLINLLETVIVLAATLAGTIILSYIPVLRAFVGKRGKK